MVKKGEEPTFLQTQGTFLFRLRAGIRKIIPCVCYLLEMKKKLLESSLKSLGNICSCKFMYECSQIVYNSPKRETTSISNNR